MSLFVCEECRCVENMARSHFWSREVENDGRALCAECNPEQEDGRRGVFPKIIYTGHEAVDWVDGEYVRNDE